MSESAKGRESRLEGAAEAAAYESELRSFSVHQLSRDPERWGIFWGGGWGTGYAWTSRERAEAAARSLNARVTLDRLDQ